MTQRNGFSLIEMLLSLGLLAILMASAIAFLMDGQKKYVAAVAADEALQNARNALESLTSAIRQAGNDPRKTSDDPCHPEHNPCLEGEPILGSEREITLRADLTGSLGDRGDPDCTTQQRFEDLTFRFAPATRELKMRSGRGRFEPIVQDLADVRFEYYQAQADGRLIPAPSPCSIDVVRVTVVPVTPAGDAARLTSQPLRFAMTVDVHVRSRK
ncbi:MAG: prepilin-type N-terminal cleavage/methylation domain-containing protein [Acidobacteria bacterium]|nr:prepilin-type N-terminal cleavage/methylation domain-containing protein [Acidobacteriota bacterium]MBI3654969.1 prepilin-type N-terminal cleavage/methylation domain-containing protein [Acidobacteriota bacterium]